MMLSINIEINYDVVLFHFKNKGKENKLGEKAVIFLLFSNKKWTWAVDWQHTAIHNWYAAVNKMHCMALCEQHRVDKLFLKQGVTSNLRPKNNKMQWII